MAPAALQELLDNVHPLLQETTGLWKQSSLRTAQLPPGNCFQTPLVRVWPSFTCGFRHSGPGCLSQAGSAWLPVPDREQRTSSERVAMRTLQVRAVSWSRAGKELLLHGVGTERGWIQTKTEGGSE